MEEEDREPFRVAALGDRQRPPIGRGHRLRARRPSHDGIILRRVHGGKLALVRDITDAGPGGAPLLYYGVAVIPD
jgi:hypothetical protein